MKQETTSLIYVAVFGLVILTVAVFMIGSREDTTQSEYEHNKRHCAQYEKVYIQKDPFSKGECMDMGAASRTLIEMHDAKVNKGLR